MRNVDQCAAGRVTKRLNSEGTVDILNEGPREFVLRSLPHTPNY